MSTPMLTGANSYTTSPVVKFILWDMESLNTSQMFQPRPNISSGNILESKLLPFIAGTMAGQTPRSFIHLKT